MINKNILKELNEYRKKLADQNHYSEPYFIFPNRTMHEIATLQPQTEEQLELIHGMGPKRIEKYGKDILEILNKEQCIKQEHDEEDKKKGKKGKKGVQSKIGRFKMEEDEDLLRLAEEGLDAFEISKRLDRSPLAIVNRMEYYDYIYVPEEGKFKKDVHNEIPKYSNQGLFWTAEEDERLFKFALDNQLPIKEISKFLNRTEYSIQRRLETDGVFFDPKLNKWKRNKDLPEFHSKIGARWTEEEDKFLRSFYEKVITQEDLTDIATKLGRTEGGVGGRLIKLGFKHEKEKNEYRYRYMKEL
ncbi:hypothetical protein HDU92_006158 [Lobulomyces angularis]|nr:hypothetical protein HDU92_006158 [Lobulomyces angularis]